MRPPEKPHDPEDNRDEKIKAPWRIPSGPYPYYIIVSAALVPLPSQEGLTASGRDNWSDLKLWYAKPAALWTEALPVGNGRLGAMVFGKTDEERIQLNEQTVWTGSPYDPARPGGTQAEGRGGSGAAKIGRPGAAGRKIGDFRRPPWESCRGFAYDRRQARTTPSGQRCQEEASIP